VVKSERKRDEPTGKAYCIERRGVHQLRVVCCTRGGAGIEGPLAIRRRSLAAAERDVPEKKRSAEVLKTF